MSPRFVYLVRHGEVANPNHVVYADLPGFNLSPLGVRQAHAAGRHLARRPIDAVVTSPLARAVQTATAIPVSPHIRPSQRPTEATPRKGLSGSEASEAIARP